MSKYLMGIAAAALLGLAAMPITATAAERQAGVTIKSDAAQSTDISAQRRHWRHRHYGYRYGPRRYYGPRYGYYRPYRPYYYGGPYAHGYPYAYRPGIAFGLGPFGFRAF